MIPLLFLFAQSFPQIVHLYRFFAKKYDNIYDMIKLYHDIYCVKIGDFWDYGGYFYALWQNFYRIRTDPSMQTPQKKPDHPPSGHTVVTGKARPIIWMITRRAFLSLFACSLALP
jgi:hypothetical protein